MHKMAANKIQATNTDLQFEFNALKEKKMHKSKKSFNDAIQTMD